MPDNSMYNDMQFDKELEEQGDDPVKLVKFVARHQYNFEKNVIGVCHNLDCRIKTIEDTAKSIPSNGNKKTAGIVGGVVGSVVAGLIVIIDYFTNR